jgi:hypothetical protein
MSALIQTLTDGLNNEIYPKTKTSAIYDENNVPLDTILNPLVGAKDEEGTTQIEDPVLHQTDIDQNISASTTKVPSSGVVKVINDNLGNPSSASSVTGADAFSKINTLNSNLANKETFNYTDITACSTYNEIVTAMKNNKTATAYGSVGTGSSSQNLRNLIGLPSNMTNLSYVGAVVQALGGITSNPVLIVFIYEQTSTTYASYSRFKFVYPIGNTYNALPWISAAPA